MMDQLLALTEWPHFYTLLRCLVLVAGGIPLLHYLALLAAKVARGASPQGQMLLRKSVFYGGIVILVIAVMHNLNFKLTAVLGTAGVVGVAIGFAAQTSLSNIISGFFMIGEKPFEVDDIIEIEGIRGTVLSIDLLSIKLRTLDNRFVRVPNESVIKQKMVNITRFPIRRWDLTIGVAYGEDVGRVCKVLREIVDGHPYVLDEPEPVIQFVNFGESSCDIFLGVWFEKDDFLEIRESLHHRIKERFDAEGIEIPFPHRSVYAGAHSEPLPVRVVASDSA
jgi:small-conductance mechanosensitive channel